MNEIWKDIVGYEGLYQISNLGRVKSLNYSRTGKENILSPGLNSGGYYTVSLFKNGEIKKFRVHRLVALAFIPNPENKPCVDHINGVRTDNCVKNLRWCTQKENSNFPLARKNISESLTNHPNKSKAILQVSKDIGDIIKEYPSIKEVERQLGIASTNISQCCNGKRNTAGGYIWRYA